MASEYTGITYPTAGTKIGSAHWNSHANNIEYLHAPGRWVAGATGVSTTSQTLVDVTNLGLTATAYGGIMHVDLAVELGDGGAIPIITLALDIGGTDVLTFNQSVRSTYNDPTTVHLHFASALASGAHTIKAQWKINAATRTGEMITGTLQAYGG